VSTLAACVDRQTPTIADPQFRQWTRDAVRRFCIFAGGETDVLSEDGSVAEADRKRILQSHPEVVSDICSAPITFGRRNPATREKIRKVEQEHREVCRVFLERLRKP
jgi:hypothetical protein